MSNQELAERIEGRIDKDVTDGLMVGGQGVQFRTAGEMMEFAKMMSIAGVCIRKDFREKPGQCLMLLQQALRWEMDPFAVANKAYVVNDQIAYESQLITALINTRANLDGRLTPRYDGDGTNRTCTVTGRFEKELDALEYTSPPIGQITPKNSPLWKNDPDQQLFYFSARAWARRFAPEVLLGVYDRDEFEHVGPDNARDVTPATRPSRSNATDDLTGTTEDTFTFVDEHGEVIGELIRDDFVDRMSDTISNTVQLSVLEAFWEFNEESTASLGDPREDADRQRITTTYNEAKARLKELESGAPEGESEGEPASANEAEFDAEEFITGAKATMQKQSTLEDLDAYFTGAVLPMREKLSPDDWQKLEIYKESREDALQAARTAAE